MSDRYDEKASDFIERLARVNEAMPGDEQTVFSTDLIAQALRESAAEAFEEAARDVECFQSGYDRGVMARTGESMPRPCAPCLECVKAARLEGKAASLRASALRAPVGVDRMEKGEGKR